MLIPISPIPDIVQLQYNALVRHGKPLTRLQCQKYWPELVEWVATQYYIGA